MTDFNMFMPTVKNGSVTYYQPETLDVLKAIKELKEQGFLFKMDIVPVLMDRGFSITVEDSVEELQKAFSDADSKDVQTKVITELARQSGQLEVVTGRMDGLTDRIDGQDELLEQQVKRLEDQDGRITVATDEMAAIKLQLEEVVKQLAVANERIEAEASKGFFARLLGK